MKEYVGMFHAGVCALTSAIGAIMVNIRNKAIAVQILFLVIFPSPNFICALLRKTYLSCEALLCACL
jgi:hypothetical protein